MTSVSATPRVPCVVGPTASGKSELADVVALRLGTAVVSVDSMQVYRGMDIGTAKVPAGERRAPLLMVDVCDPTEEYSVAVFQRDARAEIDRFLGSGRPPVLCGGTGLYLDAVIDEMTFPPGGTRRAPRVRYEGLAARLGPEALHEELARRDPASAALIHPHNVRRVVRALEMADEGMSYARHHEGLLDRAPHYDARVWAIAWPREVLVDRIERRVDQMIASGLLREVACLAAAGLVASSTAGQAIGYAEMLQVLEGSVSLDEAAERMKARTRRFAKRQMAWLRRDGRTRWLDPTGSSWDDFLERSARELLADLEV